MEPKTVNLDAAIEFINELIETDREAITALWQNRVPCNQALADHPTVQVGEENGRFVVGLLGILNGLFGVDETGTGFIHFFIDSETGALLFAGRQGDEQPISFMDAIRLDKQMSEEDKAFWLAMEDKE